VDEKAQTIFLPLGLCDKFPALKELRVESTSETRSIQQLLTTRGQRGSSQVSAFLPLTIGLANLHEIADKCPRLEVLFTAHVEISNDPEDDQMGKVVTDVWGPDCTHALVRKLRANCPNLRELGVMGSPGPRMLNEVRRLGTAVPSRPITETPEISETYTSSFLTELARFSQPIRVAVSLTSSLTPGASARSAVRHFRDELAQPLGEWESIGELADCLEVARSIPTSTTLNILVRATSNRSQGPHVLASMAERMRFAQFRDRLAQLNLPHIHATDVPGGDDSVVHINSLLYDPRYRCATRTSLSHNASRSSSSTAPVSDRIVSQQPQAQQQYVVRARSFTVDDIPHHGPKRSYTDMSLQGSQILERSGSVLEPAEGTAGLILTFSRLDDATDEVEEEEDDLVFGNGT